MPGGVNDISGAKKLVEQMKANNSEEGAKISDKEKAQLAEALANTKDAKARAYIQDELNIANGNNKVGGNNNIVGNAGSVETGDIINGDNNKNTTIINPPPAPGPQPTPVPPKPPKAKLDPDSVKQGRDLAQQMHAQTSSAVANNTKVNHVLRQVDSDNAYTFFSEYAKLAKNDDSTYTTGVMHDAHGLVEMTIFTSVDNEDTFPALNALIAQAGSLGLGNSVECQRLESLMRQHQNDSASFGEIMMPGGSRRLGNDDISAETGRVFDTAVRNLLAKMSTKIE